MANIDKNIFYNENYGYVTFDEDGNMVSYAGEVEREMPVLSLYITGALNEYEYDMLFDIAERKRISVFDSIQDLYDAPYMDRLAKRFMAIDDSDALLCVLGGNTDPVIAMADCVYAYAAGIPIYTYIAGMESDIRPFVCISDNSSFEFSELLKEIGFFLS